MDEHHRSSMARILLVDDDPHVLAAIKRQLMAKGHHVSAISEVRRGLIELSAGGIDILIADHRLGADSGLDLLLAVAELSPRTCSIVISGNISESERRDAYALGALHVLDKPFSPRELSEVLARCVSTPTRAGVERATPVP
jgi:DNA-binding NtrC family response regulator